MKPYIYCVLAGLIALALYYFEFRMGAGVILGFILGIIFTIHRLFKVTNPGEKMSAELEDDILNKLF